MVMAVVVEVVVVVVVVVRNLGPANPDLGQRLAFDCGAVHRKLLNLDENQLLPTGERSLDSVAPKERT